MSINKQGIQVEMGMKIEIQEILTKCWQENLVDIRHMDS
jgi:hypothetical protein